MYLNGTFPWYSSYQFIAIGYLGDRKKLPYYTVQIASECLVLIKIQYIYFQTYQYLISFLRIIQRIDIPVGIKALSHIMQVSARSSFYLSAYFGVKIITVSQSM